MDILFLNHPESLIGNNSETTYLRPYLIMADELDYITIFSELILQNRLLDKMRDKHILETAASIYKDETEIVEKIKYFLANLNIFNKLKSIKHKNRYELDMWMTYKKLINDFRSDIKREQEEILNRFNLMEMMPFIDEKIWFVGHRRGLVEEDKEDIIIPVISDILKEPDMLLSLEHKLDVAYRHLNNDRSVGDYVFDYIKIPLWKIPPMVSSPFEEVKHSRQQLQPALQPFKEHLEKFRKEIYGLSFDDENKEKIRQSGMEIQSLFVQPVQQAVNNCIFLSKLKNAYADYIFLRFCLGITSAENIVEYYLANKIIEPYMVSEIKKRIARESDLQSSHVFCYFEVHNDINKEFTLAEMKNEVN